METCVVLDLYDPDAKDDRIFDAPEVEKGFGECFFRHLKTSAIQHGMDIHTSDVFLSLPADRYKRAYCITDMETEYTEELILRGVIPAICFSMESPIIAKRFYFNIAKKSGRFAHSFQFEGTRARLSKTRSRFHPMYYPVCAIPELERTPIEDRSWMVLINSNKRAMDFGSSSPKELLKTLSSQVNYHILKRIDPLLSGEELYKLRIEAIAHFAARDELDLYGFRWDEPIPGFSAKYSALAKKVYKGSIALEWKQKLEVLSSYRFCVCFENYRFPGYITEKITDCLIAGTIPIYAGAPDIDQHFPTACYIDFYAFSSFEALGDYLHSLSETQIGTFLKAGADFVNSSAFDPWRADRVAHEMIDLIAQQSAAEVE